MVTITPALSFAIRTTLAFATVGLEATHGQIVASPENYLNVILERIAFTPDDVLRIDQNGDNSIDVRDLTLYYEENPNDLPFVAFETSQTTAVADGGLIQIPVYFSKSYNGQLKYEISGAGSLGREFGITGNQVEVAGLGVVRGEVAVNGVIANIPLQLGELTEVAESRPIVLTITTDAETETTSPQYLFRPAAPGVPSDPDDPPLAPTSHMVVLVSGDAGVFGGIMTVPQPSAVGSQVLNVSLLSNGTALFDCSDSDFFSEDFSVPVTLSEVEVDNETKVIFTWAGNRTASGTTTIRFPQKTATSRSPEQRTIDWTIFFGDPVWSDDKNTVETPLSIQFSGLSASSRTSTATGLSLQLGRLGQ